MDPALPFEDGAPAGVSAPPRAVVRRAARPPLPAWVNLACLALTAVFTLVAGAVLASDRPTSGALVWAIARHPASWLAGAPYAAGVLFILGSHEMGHYLACRYYRIEATLPFFLPGPNIFGTFGAVIRIRAPFTTRAALFDVGVAGPLAGFAAALPILWYGLAHSVVTHAPPRPGEFGLPPCLLLSWLYPRFFDLGPGATVQLHPAFAAAWLGLFATSLNLLPIGQLDGGHMVYALSPRAHRMISRAGIALLVVAGFVFGGYHLLFFAILFLFIGIRHPRPLDETVPLDPARRAVALLGLVIFVVTFMPFPLQIF